MLERYALEATVATATVGLLAVLYIGYGALLSGPEPKLANFVPISSAGILFVVGHIYARLKQRRDDRRAMALSLFDEWSGTKLRESRIFLSRLRLVLQSHGGIPTLGEMESTATKHYFSGLVSSRQEHDKEISLIPGLSSEHELNNYEKREFHAFTLYQFFERWALLVTYQEVDHRIAARYLDSYTGWWINEFLRPWSVGESDPHIRSSLERIIKTLG